MAAKKKKAKKITGGFAFALALCPEGSTGFSTFYKSKDGESVDLGSMCKETEEGLLLNLVYATGAVDDQNDEGTYQACRDFCESFALSGMPIKARHNGPYLKKEQAYVTQNFIVQEGDTRFEGFTDREGNPVDPVGGWATEIRILDPEYKQKYREGVWKGVSAEGIKSYAQANFSKESADDERGEEMTKEELEAILAKAAEATKIDVAALAKEVAGILKTAADEADKEERERMEKAKAGKKKPDLPKDVTDLKAMEKYRKELRAYNVDFDDEASVNSWIESLAKEAEGEDDDEPKTYEEAMALIKELKADNGPAPSTRGALPFKKQAKVDDNDAVMAQFNKLLGKETK